MTAPPPPTGYVLSVVTRLAIGMAVLTVAACGPPHYAASYVTPTQILDTNSGQDGSGLIETTIAHTYSYVIAGNCWHNVFQPPDTGFTLTNQTTELVVPLTDGYVHLPIGVWTVTAAAPCVWQLHLTIV